MTATAAAAVLAAMYALTTTNKRSRERRPAGSRATPTARMILVKRPTAVPLASASLPPQALLGRAQDGKHPCFSAQQPSSALLYGTKHFNRSSRAECFRAHSQNRGPGARKNTDGRALARMRSASRYTICSICLTSSEPTAASGLESVELQRRDDCKTRCVFVKLWGRGKHSP
jgi:hypothetical protein